MTADDEARTRIGPKLTAAPNFRDLGGLRAVDGRRVRSGVIYRCEALDRLGDPDLEVLHSLGIELICDLRSPGERQRAPNRLPAGNGATLLTADDDRDPGAADIRRALLRRPDETHEQARAYMIGTYRGFPRAFAATLRSLFDHLLNERGPLLIHCAAGKDRTGFVCAMILHALGVARQTIEADYMLSDRHFGRARIAAILQAGEGPLPASVDAFRVRMEYLDEVFACIEREHRGVDAYLEQHAGLTQTRREQLQGRLLQA
ncbi:tyrosine-protein phosphatase [Hydrocarboniphaga sp.]|uniref:tyrosine-protein phosphatase n=1 Tax=Hydrocarboniphaga sp. TaxID=2033016 RepID=UPI003D14EE96